MAGQQKWPHEWHGARVYAVTRAAQDQNDMSPEEMEGGGAEEMVEADDEDETDSKSSS